MASKLEYDANARLIEADPKPLGQRVPEPLHARLIELCDLVYEAGEHHRPTKAEMVAALILAAPEDPARLVELLRGYGRARVADAPVGRSEEGDVVVFPQRTSGPRRGRR